MTKIKKIQAVEILNSHGVPTIEGTLILDNNLMVKTSIPAGNSCSDNEAYQLRDNNSQYFNGLGVQKAVYYINNLIAPKLIGVSPLKQEEIDNWLITADGTKKKEVLGGNTILTISQLITKAGALDQGLPLYKYINHFYKKINKEEVVIKKIPTPIFNLISGGTHADKNLDFQEFLIIPSSINQYSRSLQISLELYRELREVFKYHNINVCYSLQGSYSPNLLANSDAIEIINEAITKKKLRLGIDVFIGIDFAANFFYYDQSYKIKDSQSALPPEKYLQYLDKIIKKYQLFYLEDPFADKDWLSWKKITQIYNKEKYICADDLISSNKDLLIKNIKEQASNTIVVKPTQTGTITETLQIINLAKKNNLNVVISQRSQETNDDFIADLAVGAQTDFIKFGTPIGGERIAKYNRLKEIEKEIYK